MLVSTACTHSFTHLHVQSPLLFINRVDPAVIYTKYGYVASISSVNSLRVPERDGIHYEEKEHVTRDRPIHSHKTERV